MDSDLELLHTQLKLAQGALEETEIQLRKKDEELAAIKSMTSESSSATAAMENNRSQSSEVIQSTVLLTAIQDTAAFLEELASSFEDVAAEEAHDPCNIRLPKLISNTGNKSFQNILEHEEIRHRYDKRIARAAAAIENDTQGNAVAYTSPFLDGMQIGWESTVSQLALVDESTSLSDDLADLEEQLQPKQLSAEDILSKLSQATKQIEQLLMLEKVRRLDIADVKAQDSSLSVLMVDRVTDVDLYLRRIQKEIQENLMQVKLLDMRREYVRRKFKAPDKLLSYTAIEQLPISAGTDFLRAVQEPGALNWRETRAAVPLDLQTAKKKDHRHLLDFSPLPKKSGKSGLKAVAGLADSKSTEMDQV